MNSENDSSAEPAEFPSIHMDTVSGVIASDSLRSEDDGVADQQADTAPGSREDVEALEETFDITALEATTSAHDDWLHRGPFLFDMDFHTYMRFTVRKPRPKEHKVSDVNGEAVLVEVFNAWARWKNRDLRR